MTPTGMPVESGRIVNGAAPIRICDNGGWTDTWFARHGKVFNIAVSPTVEVQVEVLARDALPERFIVQADNYGESFAIADMAAAGGRHALIEAAVERARMPRDRSYRITVYSESPAGSSTGTSAALLVALLGTLDAVKGGSMTRDELAEAARSVEVDALGRQSGIQDQLCAAHGGMNFIEMPEYPRAVVTRLVIPPSVRWELGRRLALVSLGTGHSSSGIHETVIKSIEEGSPLAGPLEHLRSAAERSRDALLAGDLSGLAAAMVANTEAQRELHPSLVSRDAERVIDIARSHGAAGWKVNGAGGEGGSLTILFGSNAHARRRALQEIEKEDALFRNIPIALDEEGLRVWSEVPATRPTHS